MKRKEKRCRNCGRYFRLGKFKPYAQHYCWDEECRQASLRAAKAKYRKKQSQSLEYRMKESRRVQG
ncbi:MAG TPA: hypothetical protein DD381_05715 [Lentisphaeria bacterium]|nr:MAG: hypothetical protein A2X47_08390 [Lentisphaerae bacterium GWF2_38_69]HBM15822.1 hypothetical protein [Lentisphaeria bacterium]